MKEEHHVLSTLPSKNFWMVRPPMNKRIGQRLLTLRLKLNGVEVVDGRQTVKARLESDGEIILTKDTNIMSKANGIN